MMKKKVITLALVVMVPFLSLSFATVAVAQDVPGPTGSAEKDRTVKELTKTAKKQIEKGGIAERAGNEKKAGKHYDKADEAMDESEEVLEMDTPAAGVIDSGCGNVGQVDC